MSNVRKNRNPRVYLDVQIGRRTGGRIVFELFVDVTPQTAENFRSLCTGEHGRSPFCRKDLTYALSKIHRLEDGCNFHAGDFVNNTGLKGLGESIYGPQGFRAESFMRKHAQAGILSMVPDGGNMCHSVFAVSFKRSSWLDGQQVAFGQVIEGMEVVRAIEKVPVESDYVPRVDVVITGSGQLTEAEVTELLGRNRVKTKQGERASDSRM